MVTGVRRSSSSCSMVTRAWVRVLKDRRVEASLPRMRPRAREWTKKEAVVRWSGVCRKETCVEHLPDSMTRVRMSVPAAAPGGPGVARGLSRGKAAVERGRGPRLALGPRERSSVMSRQGLLS